MVAHSLATTQALAHRAQKAAAAIRKGDAKPLVPTPRVRSAIQSMVFDGLKRPDAAAAVGLTDHALRTALTKPHVLAYLNEQQEVLRTGARPRALRKIIELSEDAESERVQLDASKYLDGMDRQATTVGAQQTNVNVNVGVQVQTPGYVIDLSDYPREDGQQIDHLTQHGANGLADNTDVPDDE